MKTVTVNVQIQLDLPNDKKVDLSSVLSALDKVNVALQDSLPLMEPQILTGALDDDDIHYEDSDETEDEE